MTQPPIMRKGERASVVLGLVHLDVCGPMNTNVKEVTPISSLVQMAYPVTVMCISIRGGEYLSYEFLDYLKDDEILSQ